MIKGEIIDPDYSQFHVNNYSGIPFETSVHTPDCSSCCINKVLTI